MVFAGKKPKTPLMYKPYIAAKQQKLSVMGMTPLTIDPPAGNPETSE